METRNKLSLQDTISMRGVAITFVVFHNLLHVLTPIKENEFKFDINNSNVFISHFLSFNSDLWKDVFSFLGWYGVPVFLFISGYGLSCKYEVCCENNKIPFIQFMKKHVKKMFLLMLIPYICYLFCIYFIGNDSKTFMSVIAQLLMMSNLYPPIIDPGVYWYFGLMIQLYACYHLFFLRKGLQILFV